MCGGNSSTHFPSSQKVDRKIPWVGLLARKVRIATADSRVASPSPALDRVVISKRHAFTHSGGTAPDLHRTSLLCPRGHPRRMGILAQRCAENARASDEPDQQSVTETARPASLVSLYLLFMSLAVSARAMTVASKSMRCREAISLLAIA